MLRNLLNHRTSLVEEGAQAPVSKPACRGQGGGKSASARRPPMRHLSPVLGFGPRPDSVDGAVAAQSTTAGRGAAGPLTTIDDASTGARRVAFGAAVAGALITIVCVTGVPHVDARAWTADCFRTRQLHPYGAEGAALARIRQQLARDYGTNLLGAMVGGSAEYLSLLTGFRMLLVIAAVCYVGAVVARSRLVERRPQSREAGTGL